MRLSLGWLLAPVVMALAGCQASHWYSGCDRARLIEQVALESQSETAGRTPSEVPDDEIAYLKFTRSAQQQPLSLLGTQPNGSQAERLPPPASGASPSASPATVSLRLDEVRAAALQGNLELRVIEIRPALAETFISEEAGKFEATFSAAVAYRRLDPPPGNVTFGLLPDTVIQRYEPAVNLPLLSGGVLSFQEGRFGYLPQDAADPMVHDAQYGISLTQPLLRGAGFGVNTAPVRIAALQTAASEAQTKFDAILILAEAERAYWRLYAARENLGVAREQLDLAARQLGAAKRLAVAGLVADVEALRAESGLQLRADAYLSAQTQTLLCERELKRLLQRPDIPVDGGTVVLTATPPQPVGLTFDRCRLVEKALENRMDALVLQLQESANGIRIEVARNGVLPALQLEFFSKLLGTVQNPAATGRSAFDGGFSDTFVSLSGQLPLLGNKSAQARLQRARLERASLQASQTQLEVAITQQVLDALDRFEQNWQRILAARRSVEATRKTYAAEIRLFQLGQRTGDLVLDAAARLATAQLQEIQALTDFEIAKVDVAVATGTLLGYSNIQWDASAGLEPIPLPALDKTPH